MAIYRTGDDGRTWARAPHEGEGIGCLYGWSNIYNSFAISPAAPEHLYAAYHTVGLCQWELEPPSPPLDWSNATRSLDAGVTWGRPWSPMELLELVPSPVLADRLYGRNQSGYLISDDGGQSWAARDFPVEVLVPDGVESDWLYGYTGATGLRSLSQGSVWGPWGQQPCTESIAQLLPHPTRAGVLLVRCEAGLVRSLDGGGSWTVLSGEAGHLIAPDYGNPGRILWANLEGLWASEDAGTSWEFRTNSVTELKLYTPLIRR